MEFGKSLVKSNGVPLTRYNPNTNTAEVVFHDIVSDEELRLLNARDFNKVQLRAAEDVVVPSLWKNYGGYIKDKSVKQGAEISDKLGQAINRGLGKIGQAMEKLGQDLNNQVNGQAPQNMHPNQPCEVTPENQVNGQAQVNFTDTSIENNVTPPINFVEPSVNGGISPSEMQQTFDYNNDIPNNGAFGTPQPEVEQSPKVNLGKDTPNVNIDKNTSTNNNVNKPKVDVKPTIVSTGLAVKLLEERLVIQLNDSLASNGLVALVQPIFQDTTGVSIIDINLQLININPYEVTIRKGEILGQLLG